MGKILCIETSADICSIALGINGETAICEEVHEVKQHASNITLLIEKVIAKAKITLQELDAIAISAGPGSYTGLRIGTSTAKGLCYALEKPLIAIDTLQSIAITEINKHSYDVIGVLKLARGNEYYGSIYEQDGKSVLSPKVLLINDLVILLEKYTNPCVVCNENINISLPLSKANSYSAKNLIQLAEEKFTRADFIDTAYFEPSYLRPFVALQSKNSFKK